jgi:uncharacterized protein with beta-barrel porin domain
MKKISKAEFVRPVNPAAGFGRGLDATGLRLVRRSGTSWRAALLGTAAAGAFSFAVGGPAAAAPTLCVINGTIATCSGNQSAGIASGTDFTAPPITTLNVNSLTTAITPASGTGGISFTSVGAITITSNTGAFGITTSNANGIYANASLDATVTSTGNITTTGASGIGIDALASLAATVTSTGDIITAGNNANGISAEAFNVAGSPATVTSTGNITTAGNSARGIFAYSKAGAVTVSSTGNIKTAGSNAYGIFARNVGGGAVTVTSTGNITTTGSQAYGIFAQGAGGVTVTSTGNITTTGVFALGLFARSVGGSAVTVTSTGNITTAGTSAFAIVADGNGPVTVTSTGNITTTGNYARGIHGYSSGAAVTVTSTGNITTAGTRAFGIVAAGLGHGAITVTSTGNITTAGNYAHGIFALNNNGAVTVTSTGNITTAGNGAFGIDGSGGAVTVTSTGNVITTGNRAFGIYADSFGAVTMTSTGNIATTGNRAFGIYARGYGAMTVSSTGNIKTAGSQAYGIFARNVGGGAVTVTSTGNITTTGSQAYGIAARSTGAATVTSTGNITTTGDFAPGIFALGAGVTMTSTGNITTTGTAAFGIVALGCGCGSDAMTVTSTGNITTTGIDAVGIAARSTGAVTVTSTGNITTTGIDALGIYAQSGGGPIAVTVNSGTVSGGSGYGAGVLIVGGTGNTLVNRGTVMALSGLAIGATTGNDTVSNFGTVIGNVDLGAGTNAFNNMAGGLFSAGTSVNLGAGNTLTNAGTLAPGGAGTVLTTALTGNLVQTTTGRLAVDFNMAGGSADRLNVSGTANLAGAVQLQVSTPKLGAFQQTVLSATGGTTNSGLSLLANPALQAQLVFPNATDVAVKSSGINFLTPGINGNQTTLGNTFNGAAATAGLGGPVFNVLLNGPTSLDGYRNVLSQLSGEGATGTQQATFDAMSQFVGLLLDPYSQGTTSTPGGGVSGYASEGDASAYASNGRKRTAAERDAYAMFTKAPPAAFEQRWNLWAAGFGGSQTTDGNVAVGSNGATSRIAGTAVGADYRFSPNTIAGFAMAGGGTNFVIANGLGSGRSDLFQAGVYMRHTMGAAYIAGALAYGWQDVTTNRTVTLAGLDQLQAKFNANAFSGRLEGGYRFVSPWMGMGITPYAAGQFTTFDLPAYAEQAIVGTNNFALAYGAKSVTDPRTELGLRSDKSWAMTGSMQDTILTLRGRLAWAHDYTTDRSIGATFQTLPGASFVVNGAAQAADKALTTAAAEVKWRNGVSLSGVFEGEFGSNVASYAGKGVVRYQW